MKHLFYFIAVMSILLLQSCSALRPQIELIASSDTTALKLLQDRYESVLSLKAELKIRPASVTIPSVDAFLAYDKTGKFRLTGLSPAGFTLFDVEVSGSNVYATDHLNKIPVRDISKPESILEMIDFIGGSRSAGFEWSTEESGSYYVVNQELSSGGISYPIRRWWVDKADMVIVKKELYSDNPDKHGIKLFEAKYSDFRAVNGIISPFEITVYSGAGKEVGKVRFSRIVYNEDAK